MARESTITQAAVSAAADRIKAAGGTPTARAIREALGTGSMATVLRLLQTWQSGQAQPAPREVVISPALQQMLVGFVSQEVASAKTALQAELDAAQQATADVLAENERQADEISDQAKKITALTTERDQAAAVAGERATEVERLAAEIKRLQALQEAEREARITAEKDAAVAKAVLATLREQIAIARPAEAPSQPPAGNVVENGPVG